MTIFRFLVLLVSMYVLVLIQTALLGEVLPSFLKPDLMIVMIIYLGVAAPLFGGALLALFGGFLYDTFSGSPLGLFIFHELGAFFLIKLLGRFLILGETTQFRLLLVTLAFFLQNFSVKLFPWLLGSEEEFPFSFVNWGLPLQILTTCVLGWPLLRLLGKLDSSPRAETSEPIP